MSFVVWNDPAAPVNPAPSGLAQQARLDKVDLDIMVSAIGGVSVVTGCNVTAQVAPNGTVQVSSGTIQVNSGPIAISAVASLTIPALPPANNRRDLIVVSSGGVVSVITGVAALIPDEPSVPANSVALAVIELTSTTTVITASLISSKRVTAPVVQTQVLGSLTTNQIIVHQGKPVLLLAGTFTAWSSTQMFRVDVAGQVYGGGFGTVAFLLGNNGGLLNTPLYSPAVNYVAGNTRFAGSVNLGDAHSYNLLQGLQYEQQSAISEPIRITGLAVGTVYTWQLIAGCSGGAFATPLGRNPEILAVSPDNKTVWATNLTDGTVQPTTVGYRPTWLSLGNTPATQSAGPPIATGATAYGVVCTPDGKYVVVVNNGAKTVSVVNAQTRQLVGTSTAIAGTPSWVTVTQDGTVAWISENTGKVYPVTIATQVVGAAIQVGAITDAMGVPAMSPDGKTLWVPDVTAKKVFPLTLTSNTTATVGAAFTLANAPNACGCCTTAASITAGQSAAGVSLTTTPITGYNNFPTTGGTIRVPVSIGPPVGYTTVNYTAYNATTGQFIGCSGGVGTTVAGNVVMEEGVWAGDAGSFLTQFRLGGLVQTSPTLGIGQITYVAVLADSQEIWAMGSGNKFAQIESNDAAINTPATSGAPHTFGQGIALSTDGYVFVPYLDTTPGLLFNIFAGQFSISPASPSAAGQQYCIVSASGAV